MVGLNINEMENKSHELTNEQVQYLTQLYTDPSKPGSLGGVNSFYRTVNEEGKYKLSKDQITDFLSGRDEYTLHKAVVHKFQRHHIIVGGINHIHQGDLVDMGKQSAKHNDGIVFLLTVIDCFTKMAFVQPIKTKGNLQIVNALSKIYKNRDPPISFLTDSGKEFVGKVTQKWFKDKNIQFYVAHGTNKAMYVERFHRTLKTRLSRYMTLHNTLRYIDVLQDIVNSYNNTYNRSTGYKPIDINETNARKIFIHVNGSPINWFKNLKKPKYKIGDHVRITREKGIFEKGYEETFTREVFIIDKVMNTDPREYKLRSLNDINIEGRFYEKELVKVKISKDTVYQIEKILKERVKNGKKQYYIKYKGWHSSFNEWVNENQLVTI